MRVTLYKQLYRRMMAQDFMYFEDRFKQKDQALCCAGRCLERAAILPHPVLVRMESPHRSLEGHGQSRRPCEVPARRPPRRG